MERYVKSKCKMSHNHGINRTIRILKRDCEKRLATAPMMIYNKI